MDGSADVCCSDLVGLTRQGGRGPRFVLRHGRSPTSLEFFSGSCRFGDGSFVDKTGADVGPDQKETENACDGFRESDRGQRKGYDAGRGHDREVCDRKRDVYGRSVSVSVDIGGLLIINKKDMKKQHI